MRVETTRTEIIKALTNWVNEADNETLERVYSENFDQPIVYNIEDESFSISKNEAVKMKLLH